MQNRNESRWLALLVLLIVIASGICLYFWPKFWGWALIPPIVMSLWRLGFRRPSFQNPLWVTGLVVFVVTAIVGYKVAYDEPQAWNKFCLIIIAVLLHVNIATQPVRNLRILSWLALFSGAGLSLYFLLTADFSALAVKFEWIHRLGVTWMNVRPNLVHSPSIPPNDTAGIAIIAGAYGLPLLAARQVTRIQKSIAIAALGVVLVAVLLASSRGAFLASIGALGIWLTWRRMQRSPLNVNLSTSFPYAVIAGILALEIIVLLIPSGILGASFSAGGNVIVSRAEVFRSGLSILRDFPFTGGGLASFPGLYSQYVLATPFFILPHSHNMILDVMIEQGVLGGIAFVLIYAVSVRQLLSVPRDASGQLWFLAACLSLFTAIFHGMVDDYLYVTSGPALALMPAGMAILVSRRGTGVQSVNQPQAHSTHRRRSISWQYSILGALVAVALFALLSRQFIAQWYANLGAVKMADIELADFPSGQWSNGENISRLRPAARDLQRALAYQADNETANYRLGLISMEARDYEAAVSYLDRAFDDDPTNRGVIKNLGYSYLWSGKTEQAELLLRKIPEAGHELETYVWWWKDHQRPDLSERASRLADRVVPQP